MSRKVLSLYTGAGGLDLGLEAAGFEPLVCVEMDREAVASLSLNRPAWRVSNAQLVSDETHRKASEENSCEVLTPEELAETVSDEPDLLAGGPPCQPFSKSGYWHSGDAARLEDPRADTLAAYLRVLQLTKPKVFLLENVPGLAFNKKSEGLAYLERRIATINKEEGTRYTFTAARLNAVEYGVPQLRERVFVIGHREGETFTFPAPTHQKPPPVDMTKPEPHRPVRHDVDGLKPYTTAWDAIGHLQDLALEQDADLRMRGKYAALLPTIPEGCNYLFHADKKGTQRKLFGWRTRYWSMLLKLEKGRPSWTLTAQPGPAIGPFHWNNRRLSAEELCALQTFPNGYKIVGTNRSAHKQVGNAVPSALAELLGREVRRQLLGDRVSGGATLLPPLRDHIPEPERPSTTIPPELRGEIRVYEPHQGTGKGPAASQRSVQ